MVKPPAERTGHSENAAARFDSLKEWILGHSDVSEKLHKFGGTEFRLKGSEFMHSHGPWLLDIRLSKDDQAKALRDGKALPHRAGIHDAAGWVSFRIDKDEDLDGAKALAELAYVNAKKTQERSPPRRTRQTTLKQPGTSGTGHTENS